MVANRGYASTSAATRLKLIEAASDMLDEEGHPAFTVRRIAARAGVKPQLVHYYFRSMEDLVVTVFQRSSATYFRLHDEALSGPRPLHALWHLNCNLPEARRVMEYVALAKIYPRLREAMRETGENFRAIQVDLIERISAERGLVDAPMTAPALSALLSALARAMLIEGNVGMEEGHEGLRAFVEATLKIYEPD
ncbi:TetR/AcrR family transcriptional regulator [Novosphingobium panipatense]|jgi:AcrR family transcriptional regulator|uniref:Transcriptional regulator, TetR family n=2 Tax=Novosphingobium panipatense TaxID=428991 RepID=A0ABY1QER0_9SPHN|nr:MULTISPECIES: TetR/AcrR family transcriptional regulator [Novosphingobium]SMP66270.1 transcriptional regulator, TetR family [Novosphingobium panipatense]